MDCAFVGSADIRHFGYRAAVIYQQCYFWMENGEVGSVSMVGRST